MKRLNLKFLLILLVPAIILPIGIHFIHSEQVTTTEKMWLDQAEKFKKDGRNREALTQLLKYTRAHRDDLAREQEAAHLAADIFLNESAPNRQDFTMARGRLQAAARRPQADPEAKRALERRLIDVLMKAGNPESLSEAYDLIKKHLKDTPDDAELAFHAGRCAQSLQLAKEHENPEVYYSRVVGFLPNASSEPFFDEDAALDKHNVEAYWRLAVHYRDEKNDATRGDRVIEGMFALNKDLDGDDEKRKTASDAWFNRGRYRRTYETVSGTNESREHNKQEARREIEKAVEIYPNNEIALLTIGELDFEDRDVEATKATLHLVLDRHPASLLAYMRLARLSEIERDLIGAIGYVNQGLTHHPGHPDLLYMKSTYQMELRDGDGLRKTIEEMVRNNLPRNVVLVARAVLPICDSDWSKAARRLENIEPQVANHVRLRELVLKSLALCYRQTNEFDRELGIYQRLAQDSVVGKSDDILLRLVRSLTDQGRMNDAWALLRPRLERAANPKDVPIEIRIQAQEVLRYRQKNQLDVGNVVATNPAATTSDEDIEGDPKDWLEENTFWKKVYLKTQGFLSEKKDDEAFRFMEESLDVNDLHIKQMPEAEPEDRQKKDAALAVWSNFYYFYVGKILERKGLEEGIPAALEALSKLEKKHGDNPRIVIESARILSAQPTKATREALRPLEERIAKFSEEQQPSAWVQMAAAYLRTGRAGYDDVKRCWQRALSLAPTHKPTLQQCFQFALQTDDEAGMQAVLDQIKVAVSEVDPLWKYARAFYLVRSISEGGRMRSNLEEAIRLVDEAMDVRENWAALYELRGQINESLGETEAALGDYDNARRRGSLNPRIIYRLIELQIKAGKINEAQAVLEAVGPMFPGLERFRAYLKIARGGKLDDTMSTIEDYVSEDSTDWKSFIEKGEMYRQAALRFRDEEKVKQLHEKAETAFRAAVKLGRYRPETWLSLVNFLVGTKQSVRDAEAVLRNAEGELPDDIARPVMAQGYVNLRDLTQAEHYLLAIADAEPDNLSIKKALVEYFLRTKQTNKAVAQLETMIATEGADSGKPLGFVMWARRQMAGVLLRSGTHSDFRKAVAQIDANQEIMPKSLQDAILKAQILANRPEPVYQRKAMKLLEQIYEADSKYLNFEATLLLARLYYRDAGTPPEERWAKASRLMDLLARDNQQAAEEKRTPVQTATLLAQMSSMLLDRGDNAQAAGHIRNLNLLQPNAPRAIRLLAKWNLANKNRRAAEEAIERLIPKGMITDKNAPMLLKAAQLFDEQHLDDRAETLFRRLAKEHPAGKIQLAEYLASRGQAKEANEAIAIATEIGADKTAQAISTACHIGMLAIRQLGNNATDRQRDVVAGWFSEGRTVNGTRSQLLRIRLLEADFSILVDDQAGAAKIYREMLGRGDLSESEEGQIANNLAYLLAARGEDLEEAEEYVNRAQSFFGPNSSVLDTKGVVHLMKGECEKARRSLEEATSMNAGVPGFSDYARRDQSLRAQMYFHLALAYKCVGDRNLAREAWETALARGFRANDSKPLKRELHDDLQVWINAPE